MPQLSVEQALQIAWRHHQTGRLPQAEALYRQILQQQPNHPDALHLLGVIAHQAGRHDLAVDLIGRAIALLPNHPEACDNLGKALQAQGQLDAAIAAYRQAIALNPRYGEAHSNLGAALNGKGQWDEARAACRQAIALNPRHAEAHNNLGVALSAQGQRDAALAAYRQAVALNPHFAEALYNLATALQGQGQLDEALAAFRQALALKPNIPDIHRNLGNTLKDQGQLDAALAAYRQTMALKPDYSAAHSNLLVALNYHPASTAGSLYQEARRWAQQHAEPLKRLIQPHANDRGPERRLRIGYVSADFREHASALFLVPLLAAHDHRAFEVFCYANVVRPDHITARMQAFSDHWRITAGLADEALAAMIQQDQIDILVDLKLHTANNRLLVFARKPAPVQVTWLGYPGSTGLDTIDYRLSDPYLDPPGTDESVYSERTVRLPDCFWCYDPLDGREIPCKALPALANGWVTFGCLNNFCKVNEAVLRLWAQVLRAAPSSRLLLLTPVGAARAQVLKLLEGEAIAPERIEFVPVQPRHQYLQSYHRIDLGLDTFPCNGHTTSLDSFWMGVPVVTFVGQTAMGRAGSSVLSNLGLPELAARSEEEYVRIASELAADLPRLGRLRSTLRQRMEQSPLMDAPRFARNLEAAYRQMWRRWCGP
jgi:predicted O-linked N-acetylglucosamine transferase (SPINDLY family)